MKLTKFFLAALTTAAAMGLTACNDDNNGENYLDFVSNFEVDSSSASTYYDATSGYWANVYNTGDNYKTISDSYIYYSHSASEYTWGDYTYYSWTGFCPSIASESNDVSADDVTAHQWSSASGAGYNSTGYMLAYWNVSEDTEAIPEDPALKISFIASAQPKYVYINNSNYGYWAMKNGTYYNHAFGTDDWFKVTFYGVKDNVVSASVDTYLAQNGEIVNSWKAVDLSTLGTVDYIYIQLSSSDTGEWGMNNPAYICLDNLSVRFTY